jgi:hypothetical protein
MHEASFEKPTGINDMGGGQVLQSDAHTIQK